MLAIVQSGLEDENFFKGSYWFTVAMLAIVQSGLEEDPEWRVDVKKIGRNAGYSAEWFRRILDALDITLINIVAMLAIVQSGLEEQQIK